MISMMPKYKCWECGKYFNEYKEVEESRGEFWGAPCWETMCVCPFCGGDFDEREIVEAEEVSESTAREYCVSAYTQQGVQFGATIEAQDVDELFKLFYDEYPDCEIADYYDYAEEE